MSKAAAPKKFPFAYIIRLLFTLIGFVYALLFSIKGIGLLLYIFSNYSNGISEILPHIFNLSKTEGASVNQAIIEILKYSPGYFYDAVMHVLNILILLHGVIGAYYILSTSFKMKPELREKRLFYLHLLSSIAVLLFIILLAGASGETVTRMRSFWGFSLLLAVLGGYHIGKGFFNSCITLGIVSGRRSRRAILIPAWIIAGVSIMQIAVFFI